MDVGTRRCSTTLERDDVVTPQSSAGRSKIYIPPSNTFKLVLVVSRAFLFLGAGNLLKLRSIFTPFLPIIRLRLINMPRRPNIHQRKIFERNISPSPKPSSPTIRSIPLTQPSPRFQICSESRMHAPDIPSREIGNPLDLTRVLTDAAERYALAVVECGVGDVDVG